MFFTAFLKESDKIESVINGLLISRVIFTFAVLILESGWGIISYI